MRNRSSTLISLVFFIWLGGCHQGPAPSNAKASSADEPVAQDIKQIEYGVRLAAANKRINELQRRVSLLEATPEKLELNLLDQRMTALEVKTLDRAPTDPDTEIPRNSPRSTSLGASGSGDVSPPPKKKASKLNLFEFESRSKLATPAETKAFASGK